MVGVDQAKTEPAFPVWWKTISCVFNVLIFSIRPGYGNSVTFPDFIYHFSSTIY